MQLLEGHPVAQSILDQLKARVSGLPSGSILPTIAFIVVGENDASLIYVGRKKLVAKQIGFESRVFHLPESVSLSEILKLITLLNEDPLIHGILVQSPLPAHLNPLIVFNAISVKKDVDGFSSTNLGLLAQGGRDGFLPCTPLGIAELLKYYQISLKGQHVVVMGRSLIVGKPAALLFLEKSWDATITICHSGTKNIKKITQLADVLIVAIGQPEWVNSDYVHSNAIVVDVGINRLADSTAPKGYRLTGDVAFNDVKNKVKALTPVPGGIGPLTVASLMSNTYKAYLNTDH